MGQRRSPHGTQTRAAGLNRSRRFAAVAADLVHRLSLPSHPHATSGDQIKLLFSCGLHHARPQPTRYRLAAYSTGHDSDDQRSADATSNLGLSRREVGIQVADASKQAING
ncbi:hypothetical protein AAHC03_019206 [Spirometra sp. Aus1]